MLPFYFLFINYPTVNNNENNIKEALEKRIQGLVAIMQKGIYEGERNAAKKALLRICEKHNIDFEKAVQADNENIIERFSYTCKSRSEAEIFTQVLFKYANPKRIFGIGNEAKRVFVECRTFDYVIATAAWELLEPVYRRERQKIIKSINPAFFLKHNLYSAQTEEQCNASRQKTPTKEELEEMRIQRVLSANMQDVEINKMITSATIHQS